MSGVSQSIDRYGVVFDDESLVADAGLLAAGTLMDRLGLEDLVDGTVRLGGRVGGARPGRKVLTVVSAMLVGASHIDHVNLLRAGSTGRVLPHAVMAPSTVGTFLRSFTWGHVRQSGEGVDRRVGSGVAAGGRSPQGRGDPRFGHGRSAKCRAKRSRARLSVTPKSCAITLCWRSGPTPGRWSAPACGREGHRRGVVHFAKETIGRVRRAGARGPVSVRADSGLWSYAMLAALDQLGVGWSITAPLNSKVKAQITDIEEDAWVSIGYPRGGEAQVWETVLEMTNPGKRRERRKVRLMVRRTRLVGPQAQLWPDWRHHVFVWWRHQPGPSTGGATLMKQNYLRTRPPLPPLPRLLRTRHPRPQRSSRPRPSALRQLLRQRRLAAIAPPWPTTSTVT